MYKPLALPEDAPAEARELAAKYVLSTEDVAAAFNVDRRTITRWAVSGKLRSLVPAAPLPQRRRFALDDLLAYYRESGTPFDAGQLPWPVVRHLPFSPIERGRILGDRWVSESEAARQLSLPRQSLAHLRKHGRLNPNIRLRPGIEYHQADLEAVLRAEATLLNLAEEEFRG